MANLEHTRGQRLDQKVVELFPSLSRAFATKLIEDKRISVNGAPQTKPGYKLRANDVVMVDYIPEEQDAIPDIELPILYEDNDCVVINKPIGLLTHSKGAFNPEPTVATWLFRRAPTPPPKCDRSDLSHPQSVTGRTYHSGDSGTCVAEANGGIPARAGIVHRLDRATSGVMICAKNTPALKHLQKQFSQRKAKKTYYAVVKGVPKHEAAVIDMPIERNPKAPATFRVGPQGKTASTTYRIVQTNQKYSLLELKPETGRTHQLRVHLAHLGHPIVGDVLYGGEANERLLLHAAELEITVPKDSQRLTFTAPLPTDFEDKTAL